MSGGTAGRPTPDPADGPATSLNPDIGPSLIIEGCAVATVNADGAEYETGHVVVARGVIDAVGPGPAPREAHEAIARLSGGRARAARVVDGSGCLLTPGLVNTHHHLYQWIFRGLAQDKALFEWLTELYPRWARIDEEAVYAAAHAGLGWLALSGCTTSTDHHYLFPRGAGDLLGATIAAARGIGLRFDPTRGGMDRGRSAGGLPPDELVEDMDTILAAGQDAIGRYHDPRPGALTHIALAPCSPFSVSSELMLRTAQLARDSGVRLHTHLAETADEEEHCVAALGLTPAEYAESLGWLGRDVWIAHGVHLSDAAVKRLAASGTGVAHCPSSNARLGAGHAPVKALIDAGVPVGLGVDGAASQESGMLVEELRSAVYVSRLRAEAADPARALDARAALRIGTYNGARLLGREHEIGSLEPGKCADLALWRLDGLGHADIADPVAALVLGPPAPLKLLTVHGRPIVEDGQLRTADTVELARAARYASLRMKGRS
ncbi:8-oxoguanine deaminase [Actinocrinis puniceicyclus]|uniref:8-oxoguanine deaminase n=1 Tax=Actinocrinis puniceicyclus TaxID=977794 RepID=A0A8J7WMB2_9ACTN|nr:8-oxoguanine deaminase [Actinocrinis puniceicyclus]MBS2964996.1 8-oxoguanine deaminase [Actinocrinis puniceicyclus]